MFIVRLHPFKMVRLVFGFLVAALWLPLVAWLASPSLVESLAGPIAAMSVSLTLLVAAPSFWLVRRRVGLRGCLLGGLAVSALGSVLFWAATNTPAVLSWGPFILAGALVSASFFWFVALWRNDRFDPIRS